MDALAARSMAAYREVVHAERFVDYFRTTTPELELGSLQIGSRPARRKAGNGLSSLRAIPWIFAWTQTRLHLPAWLGIEAALCEAIDEGHLDELRATAGELYKLRVCDSAAQAARVEAEIRGLARIFPRFHARDRHYLLTSFVEGTMLADREDEAAYFEAGRLQALANRRPSAGSSADLDRDVDSFDETADQVTISVVPIGGGVEIDDVEIVDTLFDPVACTSNRVVVESDRLVETPVWQPNRQATKNVDSCIEVHVETLLGPSYRPVNRISRGDREWHQATHSKGLVNDLT